MERMTHLAPSRPGPPHEPATWPVVARALNAGDRTAILKRTVQLRVIPQLLQRCPSRPAPLPSLAIERLAACALETDIGPVMDYVTQFMEGGMGAETVFIELLAPTARLLGQYWVDDHCTFADVTIGTGHLRAAMRVLQPAFLRGTAPVRLGASRALLLPQSGEQHDFGVRMLSAFFTRAGWDVWNEGAAETDAADIVRRDWVDLVGISVSTDAMLDATRRSVAAIRNASQNRQIAILVGGLPFTLDPSLADAVGADGTAADGAAAVRLAATMLPGRRTDHAPAPD